MKGIRGAISVPEDTAEEITKATALLLREIVEKNGLAEEEIVSVFFTVTSDLQAAYPAPAARNLLGWDDIPLMCMQEMEVAGALTRCIRVLLLVERERAAKVRHVYLREAAALRPDLLEG